MKSRGVPGLAACVVAAWALGAVPVPGAATASGATVAGHAAGAATATKGAAASHAAGGADAKGGAAAKAPMAPLTLDSLQTEDRPRAFLAASDAGTLARLRREVDYGSNQFRRFIGTYPPKIGIAAIGNLPNPSRLDAARARLRGIDYVVIDWPERPKAASGGPPPAARIALPLLSERVARWQLLAYERAHSSGTPPAGKTRLVPDWFDAAIGGLATLPAEQNRRVAFMRAHLDERIPFRRFLDMARPADPPAKPLKTAAARKAAAARLSAQLYNAQALAFARFLSDAEGERFLGLALEILLTGQPQSAAFNIAKSMLPHPEVLEKEWVAWMKDPNARPKAGQAP